jgi:hypothetical protein
MPVLASWPSSHSALQGHAAPHRRVVCDAEAQRLMGYLYTPRYATFLTLRFTAHRLYFLSVPEVAAPKCRYFCPRATGPMKSTRPTRSACGTLNIAQSAG